MSTIAMATNSYVPPIAVGGETAFLKECAKRLQITPSRSTGRIMASWKEYHNHMKRLVGTGTVALFVGPRLGDSTNQPVEEVPKYLLRDLPDELPTSGTVPDFVKRVGERWSWAKGRSQSNGGAEASFKKIYELFATEKKPGVSWTTLFPPSDVDDEDDEDTSIVVADDVVYDDEDEDHTSLVVPEPNVDDADVPENQVTPRPPPLITHTFVVAGKRANVSELGLGTMIIADPGGGKTFMLKHLIDSIVQQVTSIENIVMLDFKGDIAQMVYASAGNSSSDYDDVFFEVMTFGSAVGTMATLSGFDNRIIEKLESFNLSESNKLLHRDESKFASISKGLAQDLLMDAIVKTKQGMERLGGGLEVPSARDRMGQFGTLPARYEEVLAERLSTAIVQVFIKCKRANVAIPRSYGELLEEIRVATDPCCRDGTAAEMIEFNRLSQGDLDVLAVELEMRASDVSWSALYRPESVGCDADGADSVVSLSGERLLAPPPAQYNRRITIVNCALFGLAGIDDIKRRTIASTVITRLERQVTMQPSGSQEVPKSMLVIDEASFVIPNSATKAVGPDVSAMVAVRNLLKLHRDKGMSVVLATQRPKDLHTEIRSIVTGLRLIGAFSGDKNEKKMVMDSIVKEDSLRASTREMISKLKPHEFVMVNKKVASTVRSRPLKRLHESSKHWAMSDEFTLEDLMSDDARVADDAAKSHPLAPFTRNVRARFA
jgi:hypothetical protein